MKAKIGRQYVLQSSANAVRAVASPAGESPQARTTLQRVVENRSGDRFPSVTVSGVTMWDHRIYGMLGKLKRRLTRMSGPWPVATTPYLLHTTYPLSKEALGDASLLFFSELFAAKFSKIFDFNVRNPSRTGNRRRGKRIFSAKAHILSRR